MSRTRKYNVRTNAAKARDAEEEAQKAFADTYVDITEDHGLTDEEIRAKRENLLKLINEEEKQILET